MGRTFVLLLLFLSLGLKNFDNSIVVENNTIVDINLPSNSTGSPTGNLAVRIYAPHHTRYPDGSPVLIYVPGADTPGGLRNCLPAVGDDLIIIYFIFPGGYDAESGRGSDGIYDHRGENCILALRDVILYSAGKLADSSGKTIDEVLHVPVLHNNIGLLGASNGGNIVVAVSALYGNELKGYLRYIVQWESPVSSQIATVDLGPIRFNCAPNNFVNPRYTAYNPFILTVDYSDLVYNESSSVQVFHDGNGDGKYTTIIEPNSGLPTPDLNLDGKLELNEDFPLSAYTDGAKDVYSRPVTHALESVISSWPSNMATPEEADAYWDIREAVRMYDDAMANIPDLRGMVLASVKDHVQSAPDKPHIRQAFDGWNNSHAWVKINPSPFYMAEVDPSFAGRNDLPNNVANTAPENWRIHNYCMPEDIPDNLYQLAAIWEMADRVYYNRWYTLQITEASGGFGVTARVKNVGIVDASNISWSIDVEGIVITGSHTEGVIESLPAGEEATINSGLIFGVGPAKVKIMAGDTSKTLTCFLFGLLTILV